ncbi:MAG: hypothetical protein JSW28_04640, partial [Thermoplasmata archaeon]
INVSAYSGFPDDDGDGLPDDSLLDDVELLSYRNLGTMELLEGVSMNVDFKWDTTNQIGDHFIYIYVTDSTVINTYSITDKKLGNNNISETFFVHTQPDFRLIVIQPQTDNILVFTETTGEQITGDLEIGQRVKFQATIRNDGEQYVPAVNVSFWRGDPEDSVTPGVQIGITQEVTLGARSYANVTVLWDVDGPTNETEIYVWINEPFRDVPETDFSNNKYSETFNVVTAPIIVQWQTSLKDSYTVGDKIEVRVNTIFSDTLEGVPSRPYTIRIHNLVTDQPVGEATTGTSSPVGTIFVELTAPTTEGDYYVQVLVDYGGQSHELRSGSFEVKPEEPPFPWLIVLILIISAVVAVLVVGVALAKFGLGRLVECGECGAFIPEGEKKCPKCGAVFETETARCSECGGWIPVKSKSCPECGAIFAGIEKDKKDYIERMKVQYMEYVDQYRDEAKGDLGEEMTDEQFMDWWKANPKYVGFEEWLAREEELRKGKTRPCPECGTVNPESASICFKCGTIFKEEEEEEEIIEEEAPPPEVPPKAVAAETAAPPTVVPKKVVKPGEGAPPTVVPKKVVRPGEGAPPTVVPKKVVKAPPTVVPKKVVKRPPEEEK